LKTVKLLILASALWAIGVSPAECQLTLIGGVSYTEAEGGQWGIDGRLGLDSALLPIGFFGGADYFPSRCDVECGFWGWRLGLTLHPPSRTFQPFLSGAVLGREWTVPEGDLERTGMALGAGFRVDAGRWILAEATWEFLGEGFDQGVFRIGLGL